MKSLRGEICRFPLRVSLDKRPPPFGSELPTYCSPSNVVANATSALCEYYESIAHKKAETILLPLGAGEGNRPFA